MTEPDELRELVERAAAGGIATQIHAIGDAAVRAALDVLAPTAGTVPFMPRIEHVQLLDPADRGRFAEAGIAASVQPSISAPTRSRRGACGAPAPRPAATRGARWRRPGQSSRSAPTRRSSRSTRGRGSRSRSGARTPAGRPGRHPSRRTRRSRSSARCAPRASTRHARRGTGTAAGSSSASAPTWWSSRRRHWSSRSNRAAPSPRRAHRWSSSTAASPSRPDSPAHGTTRVRRTGHRVGTTRAAKAFPGWFRPSGTSRRLSGSHPCTRPRRASASSARCSRSFRLRWNHLEIASLGERFGAGLSRTAPIELPERVGEQAVEDPRRRREGVDRVGEDVDRDPGPDRQHAFVDRRRGVGAGHRGADELARRAVDDDRHVAELGLDRVAPRARGEVGDQLERVEPGVDRAVEGQPDRRRLGVRVGRARQGPVVGPDRLAERHPDRQLALVVALVGVQLRAGRVADDPQPVGDPQPPVARERRPARRVDAVVLEPEVVDRERRGRPRAGSRGPRRSIPSSRSMTCAPSVPAPARARSARTPVRTVTPSRSSAARMTSELRGWSVGASRGPDWTIVVGTPNRTYTWASSQPVGPPPRTSRLARQLAGERRLAIGPAPGSCRGRRSAARFDSEPTATTTFVPVELVRGVVMADRDPPAADDRAAAAVGHGAGLAQPLEVARVVGLGGVGGSIDHVVARGRGIRPAIAGRIGVHAGRLRRGATSTAGSRCAGSCRRTTAGRRSRRVAPSWSALNAAASPAGPAPMITKSNESTLTSQDAAGRHAAGAPRRPRPRPSPTR